MGAITWAILGAIGVSLLWAFVLAFLLDVIGAQRTQLNAAQTTLRLYRLTRTDSDAQIRALLDQNERLARQLIDRAAESTTSPVITVPATFFRTARES